MGRSKMLQSLAENTAAAPANTGKNNRIGHPLFLQPYFNGPFVEKLRSAA